MQEELCIVQKQMQKAKNNKVTLTLNGETSIMETKQGGFVSIMREKIIYETIESLQHEGLRFSVDMLAEKLKVSKKTIYKYFPTKKELALAMYERYYLDAKQTAHDLLAEAGDSVQFDLLHLYYDSKRMIHRDIFNKFQLNEVIYSYAASQNDALWKMISSFLGNNLMEEDINVLRVIIDGTFEKTCEAQISSDAVIERLVKLL